MNICVTSGTGSGPTPLAAFDAALQDAGIANFNLMLLSSVIPPNSTIQRRKYVPADHEYGTRLYVVMARHTEERPGISAWAGLGWTQGEERGEGLFVEIDGGNEAQVHRDIHCTLDSMVARRPNHFGRIEQLTIGVECHDAPVCAIVAAVYATEGW